MLGIALTSIPFFALVLAGWIAARTRRLPADSVAPLNGFVLWFALPAMLLRFVAQTPVETVVDPRVALGYAACGLAAYALAVTLLRTFARSSWIDSAYGGLAAAWPNWGYMGFGLMPALFGERAIATMIAAGIMDLLVLMPVALLVASRQNATGSLGALAAGLKTVARNPLFIAIVIGLALSLLQVKIPGPIDEFLRLLASSAGPVALFAIGVFVYRPGPVRADVVSWWLIAVKLLVHPLLMWVVGAWILQLDRETLAVATATAALPAAGTAFILVERNGGNVDRVASAILLSTVLSFVTITGLTAWLRAAGG
ncbi:AEC family transporter [Piscinibacter sakaiensis]|uniref:AEC family transporter n=1 Tax=Piscinibacter sakaiensis TaxID=1547922 RepID=UPI003AAB2BFA